MDAVRLWRARDEHVSFSSLAMHLGLVLCFLTMKDCIAGALGFEHLVLGLPFWRAVFLLGDHPQLYAKHSCIRLLQSKQPTSRSHLAMLDSLALNIL